MFEVISTEFNVSLLALGPVPLFYVYINYPEQPGSIPGLHTFLSGFLAKAIVQSSAPLLIYILSNHNAGAVRWRWPLSGKRKRARVSERVTLLCHS